MKIKQISFLVYVARMLAVGFAQGPPQHMFYTMLDRYVPGRVFSAIATKIVLDQLIASPMCIGIFFLGLGVLEGKDLTEEFSELRNKFWTVYMVCSLTGYLNYKRCVCLNIFK
jgi:protein Mpv17